MTPSDVHAVADRLGVPWDNDEAFMDRCELLTGKRHLDEMTEEELEDVVDDLEMRKEAAWLEKAAGAIPQELLEAAQNDPALEGTVLRAGGAHRVPIYAEDEIVGFFTPRQEGDVWRVGPVYVSPEHRGGGHARAAIAEFLSGRAGRAEIDEGNTASQRMFEAAGFEPAGDGVWTKTADLEKDAGRRTAEVLDAIKQVATELPGPEHLRAWTRHAALNLGQATDEARLAVGRDPHGVPALERAKDAGKSAVFAALPPTHHTADDMAKMMGRSHADWFMEGFNPRVKTSAVDSVNETIWSGFFDELGKVGREFELDDLVALSAGQ